MHCSSIITTKDSYMYGTGIVSNICICGLQSILHTTASDEEKSNNICNVSHCYLQLFQKILINNVILLMLDH